MNKLNFFLRLNNITRLLIFLIASVFFTLVFNFLIKKYSLNIDNQSNSLKLEGLLKFYVLAIIAPFFETIFLNFFPVWILRKYFSNKIFVIFLSSFVFSCLHYYSLIYIIFAFFSGIILNSFLMITLMKNSELKSVLYLILLHSLYNIVGFLLFDIFEII